MDFGCEADCNGDVDGSGTVDFNDLITVITDFGCGAIAGESNEDCDDGDDCTIDICTGFGCFHFPIGGCGEE